MRKTVVLYSNFNSSKVFIKGPQLDGSHINKFGGEGKYKQVLSEMST